MNINCIICRDLFVPTSAIYITRCGHIFHYTCLLQWMQRSKTCPQCRNKTSEKTIFRVYFNIITSEGIEDNAVTLQSKLDAAKLQLHLKESHIKNTEEIVKTLTEEKVSLENKNKHLKGEMEKYKAGLASTKDHLNFYKDKAKIVDKVEAEVLELREQMRQKEQSWKAITGSIEEASEIIYKSACPKTLTIIATSLKKEVQQLEKKKNKYFTALKKVENELHACRKEIDVLISERDKLKNDLLGHKECEEQIQILKTKIAKVIKETSNTIDSTLVRVVTESPAPLLTKSQSKRFGISLESASSSVDSPTVDDRIKEIKDSDSPYMKIKSSSLGLFINQKEMGNKYGSSDFSIFKSYTSTGSICDLTSVKKTLPEYDYDGLGGHCKDDRFPVPISTSTGVKRSSKSVTMSSKKFKKLSRPNKRIDDFLDITQIE